MQPQSRKDKWFMRGKDALLFLISSGAIISLVHIWETPKKVEDIQAKIALDKAYADNSINMLDKRVSIVEVNLSNQTELLRDIKTGQSKMWEKISSRDYSNRDSH